MFSIHHFGIPAPGIPCDWSILTAYVILVNRNVTIQRHDSKEKVEKAKTKNFKSFAQTTTWPVHHFFWHVTSSLSFLHDYNRKKPNIVIYGERKYATTKFYFSFWTEIGSLEIQLQESSPTLDKVSGSE